ncbi:hypothetical protein BGZ74_011636 [Mortierella antarctica]|nr:hypothetical protein BGZ74_011636 [Mortierella antarctica]
MPYTSKRIHLSRSLGSFLLSLVILSTFSPSTHGLVLSNKNNNNLWKRDLPNGPHSPYSVPPDKQPPGELSRSTKKRSLYSHINGDIDTPEHQEHHEQIVIIEFDKPADNSNKKNDLDLDDRLLYRLNWDATGKEPVEEGENEAESELDDDDDETRTLIEPHYPSIDLFDDDSFVVDEDERRLGHTLEDHDLEDETEEALDRLAQSGGTNQVWMVDEWEEELEGEMDELMEWIEEDDILNRLEDYPHRTPSNKDKVLGSGRLRDRQRSFADETSRFQRLFSESWLF